MQSVEGNEFGDSNPLAALIAPNLNTYLIELPLIYVNIQSFEQLA